MVKGIEIKSLLLGKGQETSGSSSIARDGSGTLVKDTSSNPRDPVLAKTEA